VEVALAPAVGGSIAALRLGGVDLLRPAPAGSSDPLSMGSFPLAPYANRIAHGRFACGGRQVQLPLNFGDHPHSLHGLGWTSAWAVAAMTPDSATLIHRHDGGDGWPWAYRAEQHFFVTVDGVAMTLTLHNLSDRAMPAGLGFHPYFCADEKTRLQFDADSLWLSTPDMLPERRVAGDGLGNWAAGAPVMGESLIDNVYGGWNGCAFVERGDGVRLELTATGAPWLHLFRPPQADFFCVEPVSHMPDAINRPDGMDMIAPGTEKSLSLCIRIGNSEETLSKARKIA